jgi:hypothetical protein
MKRGATDPTKSFRSLSDLCLDASERGEWPAAELPRGWRWAVFDEIFEDVTDSRRKLPTKDYQENGRFPVVDQGAELIAGYSERDDMVHPSAPPCIIFGDHTKCIKLINTRFIQGADGVKVLIAKPGLDLNYLRCALNAVRLPDKGYSRHMKFLRSTVFPVCDPDQQQRIVTKLDSLTGRTARARQELERIPRLVAKYREAILAAAFDGELTREWREPKGLNEPSMIAISELCLTITDGDHQAPPKAETGIPFITISAMNDSKIDLTKATRFVPHSYWASLKPSRKPQRGDVLYSVTGSIGIPALVETDEKFVFQRHISILKPDTKKTDGKFLAFLLAAPQIGEQARAVATGTAQLTIPLSGLRTFTVPYPAYEEQQEIVRRIETAFAWLDRVAVEHANASRLLPKLDQAILAKAFCGELLSPSMISPPVLKPCHAAPPDWTEANGA